MARVNEIIETIDDLRKELAGIKSTPLKDDGLVDARLNIWTKRACEQLGGWGFLTEQDLGCPMVPPHDVDKSYSLRDESLQALRDDIASHREYYESKFGLVDSRRPIHESVERLAKMAIAFLGLAYVCGFLVLYTFLRRFGIADSSTELLRVRYIYTGILCLAFPLFFLAPVGAHLWMILAQSQIPRPASRRDQYIGQSRLSFFVQLVCVGWCLYWFVIFEPYGAFHRRLWPLTLLIVTVVVPSAIWSKHLGFAAIKEHDCWRWTLAAACVALSAWALWGDAGHLFRAVWSGRTYFILIVLLAPFFIRSVSVRIQYWFDGQRTGALVARSAIAMTLTLLSTLAFAYRIFPLISADKGGGNFAQSRVARLCTGTLDQNAQPTELFGDSDIARCSVPVVVIESSDNVLWVSRTDDRGGAVEDGQKCAPEIWAEGHFYPRIFEINRTKLSHVEYERVPATGDKVRLIGRKTDIYEVLNTSDHESRFEVRSLGGKTSEWVCRASAVLLADAQKQSGPPSPVPDAKEQK